MEKKEHIEIILEDMQAKLDLLIERNASLCSKLDRINQEIQNQNRQMKAELANLNP